MDPAATAGSTKPHHPKQQNQNGPEAVSHQCRLCLEEDSVISLVSCCSCTGSVKYIHARCVCIRSPTASLSSAGLRACLVVRNTQVPASVAAHTLDARAVQQGAAVRPVLGAVPATRFRPQRKPVCLGAGEAALGAAAEQP